MVTHLCTVHGLDYLTSVIWPFTLTAYTFGSCLYCANVSHYMDGWAVNFVFFSQRNNRIPKLNASILNNKSMRQTSGYNSLQVVFQKAMLFMKSLFLVLSQIGLEVSLVEWSLCTLVTRPDIVFQPFLGLCDQRGQPARTCRFMRFRVIIKYGFFDTKDQEVSKSEWPDYWS